VYYYRAYCLNISSEIELTHLPPAEAGGDVMICRTPSDSQAGPPPKMSTAFHVTPRLATLAYAGLGTLTVRGGREILVTPLPDADESQLPHRLTGEAMAVLLYQRGLLVLQASAVAIGGVAAVFIAGRGGDKSSIAARLVQRGHQLLADEFVAVDLLAGQPVVIRGPALDAGSLAAQLDEREVGQGADHALLSSGCLGCAPRLEAPVPLRAVYYLQPGFDNNIVYQPLKAGLTAVMYHSYPPCLIQPGGLQHLQQCSRLVGAVPVCELTRRPGSDEFTEVAELVERHLISPTLGLRPPRS
jgi:hypothetical protein